MFKAKVLKDLKKAISGLGFSSSDIVLSIPENPHFGDYTTNIALQLSKQSNQKNYQNPSEIASEIIKRLGHPNYLERVEVAGAGFLNFFIKDQSLVEILDQEIEKPKLSEHHSKRYLIEFAHPNTHKAFHIGHLRNISIGESIARILSFEGNYVFRVTYGGDIGPHVAKALWGVMQLEGEYQSVKSQPLREKAEFLGKAYAYGSQKYEEDPKYKSEIDQINKKLYSYDPEIRLLWEETKLWSIAYFDCIYSRVNTEFDAQIWESEVQEVGVELVKENIDKIFIEDQGAIIFPGEKYGLHNRVFITKAGYPTYEGKELGLTEKEIELFPYDSSLHIVASEQEDFFKVTTKAIELIDPNLVGKKKHLSYGMVNLSTGKMSSRKGGVITAESLIDQVAEGIKQNFSEGRVLTPANLDAISIGAIKFFYLKYGMSSDIAFDVEKSISLQGDSGPYVMYVYTRIQSILTKADNRASTLKASNHKIAQSDLSDEERALIRELLYFQDKVMEAATNFTPNTIASYLLVLAKRFNGFYEKNPVLGSDSEEFRIKLIKKTSEVIASGLGLLGIKTVDRM